MSEPTFEPTDDSVPDGTQLPHPGADPGFVEEGDADVNDDGTEEWYGESDD